MGITIFLLAAIAGTGDTAMLQLTCFGGGAANKSRTTNVYASNAYGDSAWGQASTEYEAGFEDQVDVSISGSEARIRLPKKMLPTIRGGDDGWFKLKGAQISDRAISGTASVNPINNPKVHIDRLTGTISISGKAGEYFGRCQKADPTSRAF